MNDKVLGFSCCHRSALVRLSNRSFAGVGAPGVVVVRFSYIVFNTIALLCVGSWQHFEVTERLFAYYGLHSSLCVAAAGLETYHPLSYYLTLVPAAAGRGGGLINAFAGVV